MAACQPLEAGLLSAAQSMTAPYASATLLSSLSGGSFSAAMLTFQRLLLRLSITWRSEASVHASVLHTDQSIIYALVVWQGFIGVVGCFCLAFLPIFFPAWAQF